MTFDVDLFVIGAGSGGVRAARVAAEHGAQVMVAESSRIGGTCVIRGCVPKKLMVYASRFADDFADAAGFGWRVGATEFDWRKLVAAKEKEITRLSRAYRANIETAGGAIVEERARLEGPQSVRLASGRLVTARHILIATGAAPDMGLAIPGIENAISSNEIFDLEVFPKRLLVVGGGYIAVEFASLFARLGSAVTLVARGENILRGFDDDMREGLRDAMARAGVRFGFARLPTRIERRDGALHVALSDGEGIVADQVLNALGRRPNTKDLGLAAVGVALDASGAVKVNAYSRSSVETVHAVGDVTDRLNLTPVAIREGHAFADTIFGGKPTIVDHRDVPSAVFATPEIGAVGLTEKQARDRFEVVDIYRAEFTPMKATLSGRRERSIMKIVVDGATDRVLGVHILGHESSEMVQLLAIAIKMDAKKADFDATMALHPTAAEELVTMRERKARYVRSEV
jgi:glutathione reductase (NADPH)